MRVAMVWMFVWAIGLSAGCSSSDAPLPSRGPSPADSPEAETVVAQPATEATPSTQPAVQPAAAPGPEKATAAGPVMDEKTGIAVGQKAPSFQLNDQNGQPRSLEEFTGKGKVALVFFRSADW